MRCLAGEILSKISIDNNACWNFTGGRTGADYGVISFGRSSKQRGVHIISHELYKGKVPPNMFVLHRCDNPSCCNPDHLFLGTQQDNKDDEVFKGRNVYGERVGNHKLTEDDVRCIRILIAKNHPISGIARKFGVTIQAIHYIKSGRNWGWLR